MWLDKGDKYNGDSRAIDLARHHHYLPPLLAFHLLQFHYGRNQTPAIFPPQTAGIEARDLCSYAQVIARSEGGHCRFGIIVDTFRHLL
jgi:hypothetical protein